MPYHHYKYSTRPKCQQYETWLYPPIGVELEMVRLDDIGVYITYHQNTVAQYIAPCPIMDLCLEAERNLILRLSSRFWEQPALGILGLRAVHAAAEVGEGYGGVHCR